MGDCNARKLEFQKYAKICDLDKIWSFSTIIFWIFNFKQFGHNKFGIHQCGVSPFTWFSQQFLFYNKKTKSLTKYGQFMLSNFDLSNCFHCVTVVTFFWRYFLRVYVRLISSNIFNVSIVVIPWLKAWSLHFPCIVITLRQRQIIADRNLHKTNYADNITILFLIF